MSDSQSSQQSPVQIIFQDGEYWVSLNVARLAISQPSTASLIVWLSELRAPERVRLFIHTGSGFTDQSLDQYMPLINAILLCRAKVVGVIDHIFTDYSAYILLSCSELSVTRFGQLTLSPLWRADEDRISDRERCAMDPALMLLEIAQTKGWITSEEIACIKEQQPVYIPQKRLKARLSP